jgi:(S)-2-hydroxyglutarate dehydrogenase
MRSDIIIIGGGIIGLATSYNILKQYPNRTITILEKESELCLHQSKRNSGVMHSGIYYKPNSLKSINCQKGKRQLEDFCTKENIPYKICGKLIVAVEQNELPVLFSLFQRGKENGINCEIIERPKILELEPYCAGIKAIHIPETGIVDFNIVGEHLAKIIKDHGHKILTGTKVLNLTETSPQVYVETTKGTFQSKFLINCAGLYSDRFSKIAAKIVPFRGEYFKLRPGAEKFCNSLIYPVPNPQFPFLGVHFTRNIHGTVKCGPNAVMALSREGYYRNTIDLKDTIESLTYPGFLKIARKYWYNGLQEIFRSLSKTAFTKTLQRLIPAITSEDLIPTTSGVRAQVITPDGQMVDDFLFHETNRTIHVINAPSPGATASLNIGKSITEKLIVHGL